jgi:DNA-binding transcriptional MerR regulator
MTIDQLARRAGITTRSVRLYQTKGLLPPPALVGRVGHYDRSHLNRLVIVERLQKRGFSLASIRELLDRAQQGQDIEAVLGTEARLAQPWYEEEPVLTTRAAIEERLGRPLGDADIERAVALGLVAPVEGGYSVRMPSVLEFGIRLTQLGVPPERALDELGRVQDHARALAQSFGGLMRTFLLPNLLQALAGRPERLLDELAARATELRLGVRNAVMSALLRAIDEHVTNFRSDDFAHVAAGLGAERPPQRRKRRR